MSYEPQDDATSRSEVLTIRIAVGGSAKRIIVAVSHMFLFDSAYARIPEKATNHLA